MNRIVVQPAPCLLDQTCDQLPTAIVVGYIILGVFVTVMLLFVAWVLWSTRK